MAQQMHAPRPATGPGAEPPPDTGEGWATFAGVMFLAAGVISTVYGFTALINDDYFASDELLWGDLTTWGIIYLVFAVALFAAAFLIFAQRSVGALLGIGLAVLHGTFALMSIGAYPVWTVIVLVIDGLIIYGLTVHGPEWA